MWGVVFPGQGSQHPGMGKFLYENFIEAKEAIEEASDALHQDMSDLLFNGSDDDLKLTKNTQPALLLVSTACFQVLRNLTGFAPKAAAGHSIGEYAALVTSEALSFADAIRAVRIRGEAMQDAVPLGEGGMCAVLGLPDDEVKKLCTWTENESGLTPLEPANFNCPGQVVISGNKAAMDWLSQNFKKDILKNPETRVKFIPLKVSAPFHCSLMKPAQDRMAQVLGETKFQNAKFPIVQNVNAVMESRAKHLRENVIQQVSAPVLWTQCIQVLRDSGAARLVECGSGNVLAALIKKIDGERLITFNMNSLDELKNLETRIKQ